MAKEVIPFAIIFIALSIIFYLLHIKILLFLSIFCLIFVFFFFRDPQRNIIKDDKVFLSAADGKIVEIKDELINNIPYIRVSVFMSLFNVHINRIPANGVVADVKHIKGSFPLAWQNYTKKVREHSFVKINSEYGQYYIKQVAGFIARRIVCNLKPSDKVRAGSKFGMIKFSSRLEHSIPMGYNILVKEGDNVKGGITILARVEEAKI